ncbi:TonB family protein [Catenovulum agarivorans DS-2]|uniref:Protein TonB n=1 Tax=Catenovulum agarivorans DS-2 TaxID=1328313 RepID=W7QA43_9ALTE|nr:energy transducer TonB [Catenovulum agarivorans]EWH09674.1 TonB family protein [Catenovulum agarivorans DS-2]
MIRLLLSIPIGIAITFGLFVLMAELIANNQSGPEKGEEAPRIEIVMNKPSDSVQQRTRTPPPPPPPPQSPPPPQQAEPETTKADAGGINLDVPNVNTGGVDVGIGDISGALMKDGDATPIVRIEPRYPAQAARDGIEGWVELSFTIDEVGGVIDVDVINSEPRRIFDREAKKALAKWKYKPKIVDGKPVKQPGLTVRLDFTLAK